MPYFRGPSFSLLGFEFIRGQAGTVYVTAEHGKHLALLVVHYGYAFSEAMCSSDL